MKRIKSCVFSFSSCACCYPVICLFYNKKESGVEATCIFKFLICDFFPFLCFSGIRNEINKKYYTNNPK